MKGSFGTGAAERLQVSLIEKGYPSRAEMGGEG